MVTVLADVHGQRSTKLWNAMLAPIILFVIVAMISFWITFDNVDKLGFIDSNETNILNRIVGTDFFDRTSSTFSEAMVLVTVLFVCIAGASLVGFRWLFEDELKASKDFDTAVKNATYMLMMPASMPLALGLTIMIVKTSPAVMAVFMSIAFVGILWNAATFVPLLQKMTSMEEGEKAGEKTKSSAPKKSKPKNSAKKKKK